MISNSLKQRKSIMEPEKPDPTDCCGSGCSPCVFDIYEQRLKSWRENPVSENMSCRTDLLSETRFKPFQLIHKEQLTEDVYLYQFQPKIDSDGELEICGFLPYAIGQHLIVRCVLKLENEKLNLLCDAESEGTESFNLNDQSIITRAYTPISLANEEKNCSFKVFVKIYRNGIGSKYFRSLQVSDIAFWRGPYGSFKYKPNVFKYILMVCIGTGLAPMIPIANSILINESDETILHLLYGVKNIDHIIMRDDLRKMSQFWNFSLQYFFSQSITKNSNMKFGESFINKTINECSISDFLRGKDLKRIQILVCGTEGFASFVLDIVSKLGIDPENIFLF